MTSLIDPFPSLSELVVPGRPSAGRDADGAVEDGYAEGLRRGYEDGRRAAEADVRSDVSFALTALHRAIEDLHHRAEAGLGTMASEAVDLALAIAEVVVGREIDTAIDPGRDALVRALAIAPERHAVVARVHPADLDRLGDVGQLGRDVELVADPYVERGGCVLDVGAARVDAQLGPALARVRAQLEVADLDSDPHPVTPVADPSTSDPSSPAEDAR